MTLPIGVHVNKQTFTPHDYANVADDMMNALKADLTVAVYDTETQELLGLYAPTSNAWGFEWIEPWDYFATVWTQTVDHIVMLREHEDTAQNYITWKRRDVPTECANRR